MHLGFYLITYFYKFNNYWLDESLVNEDQKLYIPVSEYDKLLETGESNGPGKSNQKPKKRKNYTDYEILRAQIWRWQLLATLAFVFTIAVIVLGHLLNKGIFKMLTCQRDDYFQWYPLRFMGQFFATMHVLIIIAACLQAERAFYTVPHKMGYFERRLETERRLASDATSRRDQSKKVWVLPPGE